MSHTPEHITTAPVVPVQEGIQAGIGGFSVPTSAPASITADDLTSPATPITLPPQPVPTTPDLAGGQATIDALNKLLGGADSAPASLESMFKTLLPESGVPEAQQDILTKQTTSKVARDKLAAINAQLAGISAEVQAAPIRLQEEATGRGVTKAGLAPLEAGELRKIALRALPLQAQALAAQAEVAAAQGDVELSQKALELAQDKLKIIFDLKTTDVTNLFNFHKDLRDKAFTIATDAQKERLAALNKADDRKFTNWQNIINDAQSKASALMSTQPSLAAAISARVGQSTGLNDTTLGTDVAKIMEGVKAKIESDLQFVSATDNQPAGYFNKRTGQFTPLEIKGRGGAGVEEISPYQAERQTRNLQSVSELKLKVDTTPGIFGKTAALPIPSFLRSEGFRNFRAELDTLKANIAFGELTAMREASKTGGALGQVSDKEGALLQAALGALDMTQSPENFKKQLQKINDSIVRWQTAIGTSQINQRETHPKEGSTQEWEGKTYKLINKIWVEQ